ncbi:hypothetical protein ASPZODRAFT_908014 [Penicilliopsis zonata CBS 506.65]|uniref:Uncharacterized protein n=1 Tax=Penicilliopsis zonata CBS 506.65 TaxID=1073090 RepID=A0A1L9S926_9EURO|nr:hypothetical protein ASPZODRAFT_908014 [Penicilliopsis zonata CBS 506.65]OJJ43658.1 hypothetical protein ASPZODRAFT_908014 [Penicilliopsis zonata CBS 506.65]
MAGSLPLSSLPFPSSPPWSLSKTHSNPCREVLRNLQHPFTAISSSSLLLFLPPQGQSQQLTLHSQQRSALDPLLDSQRLLTTNTPDTPPPETRWPFLALIMILAGEGGARLLFASHLIFSCSLKTHGLAC